MIQAKRLLPLQGEVASLATPEGVCLDVDEQARNEEHNQLTLRQPPSVTLRVTPPPERGGGAPRAADCIQYTVYSSADLRPARAPRAA